VAKHILPTLSVRGHRAIGKRFLANGARDASKERRSGAGSVNVGRHEDDVRVVRRPAIGPDRSARSEAGVGRHVQIEPIIAVFEEGAIAVVAALRDMMRHAGNDDTSHAWSTRL